MLGKGGRGRSGVARLVEWLRCGEPPVPAAGHAPPHGAPKVRKRQTDNYSLRLIPLPLLLLLLLLLLLQVTTVQRELETRERFLGGDISWSAAILSARFGRCVCPVILGCSLTPP